MSYVNPIVESSYYQNDLGKTIYDFILNKKPNTVVEFGCLYGYSTIAIASALRDLGNGKLICFYLWDDYKYKHSTMEETISNIKKHNLDDYVLFEKRDFNDWLDSPTEFDVLHLDISNTGDIILKTYNKLKKQIENGSSILFEGGSVERDNIEWMLKYNATPINSIKELVKYKLLNENFPSMSVIEHE